MLRAFRLSLGALVILAASAIEADAQGYYYPYGQGYGGYGFGGFGGTAQGDIARGMGAFAAGAGTYNYDTSVANSINANTLMGINQYVWLSQRAADAREHEIMARRRSLVNKTQVSAKQVADQILNNPTESDIDSGAALNAVLHQLSDPKILNGSALRLADAQLDSKLIRAVPFRDATDAITISLDQLTDEKAWPFVLRDPRFDAERAAYTRAVDQALEEDKNGDLSPATIRAVRQAISNLNRRVNEVIPRTKQPDHLEATNYLNGLAGFSKMLEKSKVEGVLAELEKIDKTTVGHLIAFMNTYNLQFGAATTPGQKSAYQTLYPTLVATRDKMIGRPGQANNGGSSATPPPPSPGNVAPSSSPTAIFHGMDPKILHSPTGVDPNANAGGTGPNLPGSPR